MTILIIFYCGIRYLKRYLLQIFCFLFTLMTVFDFTSFFSILAGKKILKKFYSFCFRWLRVKISEFLPGIKKEFKFLQNFTWIFWIFSINLFLKINTIFRLRIYFWVRAFYHRSSRFLPFRSYFGLTTLNWIRIQAVVELCNQMKRLEEMKNKSFIFKPKKMSWTLYYFFVGGTCVVVTAVLKFILLCVILT